MDRKNSKVKILPSRFNRTLHQFAFFGLIAMVFFAAGCDQKKVYEINKEIKNYTWKGDSTLQFQPVLKDTNQMYKLLINIRHSEFYKYSNIWLRVKMNTPDSVEIINERFEIILAEKSGKWLGDCSGDICQKQATFRSNFKFKEVGEYTINLSQIMRSEALPEIMGAGFRIEKTTEKEK